MTSEEIKQMYSMKDIILRYGLYPNRRGYINCPFHGEKTASMKIKEDYYHCFGCGEHGDIFSFVQKMENKTFSEVYKELGGEYETTCNKSMFVKNAHAMQRKKKQLRKETEFQVWKKMRLGQICTLLKLYDGLAGKHLPFTDEWSAVINNNQLQEYYYDVLVFGSREEQEEMRTSDG